MGTYNVRTRPSRHLQVGLATQLGSLVRFLALAVAGAIACGPPDDVYCEGEELDFSVVGDLSGIWIAVDGNGFDLVFDNDHRLRQQGDFYEFGCEPSQLPLVLGGVTIFNDPPDPKDIHELLHANFSTGAATMIHQRSGARGRRIARRIEVIDENSLLYFEEFSGATSLDFESEPILYSRKMTPAL